MLIARAQPSDEVTGVDWSVRDVRYGRVRGSAAGLGVEIARRRRAAGASGDPGNLLSGRKRGIT